MSAVVEIRSTLMADLRRRYPNLRPHHDDLSNDTIADLLQWLQGRSAAPSDEEKLKIARRILQRRIADFFRARVRVAPSEEHASSSQPDREAQIRRLSSVVFAAMGKLTSAERSLLIDGGDSAYAMTSAERKQRERLRERLRDEVKRLLGASVDEILSEGGPDGSADSDSSHQRPPR